MLISWYEIKGDVGCKNTKNYGNLKFSAGKYIDNKSDDDTVRIAKECGAKVIEKIENKGYSHSIVMGLNEALKTNANIITITITNVIRTLLHLLRRICLSYYRRYTWTIIALTTLYYITKTNLAPVVFVAKSKSNIFKFSPNS